MAFVLPPENSRAVSSRRRKRPPMSEINVTPFVDVMLVLLIVFMVTAPLLTVGVPVDLPTSSAKQIGGNDEPLVVTVNSDGKIFLQDTSLRVDQLIPRLSAIMENKKNTRIFLRGDKRISYGKIMVVMGALNQAGFRRVALITETKVPVSR